MGQQWPPKHYGTMTKQTTHAASYQDMALRRDVAQNIRALMAHSPLRNQLRLAEVSGIAQSTIGRILACEVAANTDTLHRIAWALNVPAMALAAPSEEWRKLLVLLASLEEPDIGKITEFAQFIADRYIGMPSRLEGDVTQTQAAALWQVQNQPNEGSHGQQTEAHRAANLPRRRK